MKLKSNRPKATAEQVVKNIRRATRRHYSRSKLFSVACGLKSALLSCTASKVFPAYPHSEINPPVQILDAPGVSRVA